jgi:TatD DNase family protein
MIIDSHCHLDFPEFSDELNVIVEDAAKAGIGKMLTIGTRLSHFDGVREVAEKFGNIYCTVGVHPHEAGEQGQSVPDKLIDLAGHPKVVGIGETGLDYFYDKSPREAQQVNFRNHIAAARSTGLPLIVHSRDADDDMADILAEEMGKGQFSGVMHCFSSGRVLAEKAVELGFYISLSGILTFKNAEDLRSIAKDLPLDRLLVETDAPYLAPMPHRGKRNEPAFVVHTAQILAEIRNMSFEQIADATTDNFHRLFTKVPADLPDA